MEKSTGVRDVKKSFGKQVVLDGVSLELRPKEITGVLGRSGTGKSVLLKILMGLECADAGQVSLAGHDITQGQQPELNEARMKVGFLFQQSALYDSMSIGDNIAFPIRRHSKGSPDEVKQKVDELLNSVGMGSDADKMPSQVSGGMKKRAGLARALALDPEVVLLDEPTAGLDPVTAAEIARLIAGLRDERGMTALVVTHDLATCRKIADRLVTLKDGKVIFDGSLEEFQKSTDPFIAEYLKETRFEVEK